MPEVRLSSKNQIVVPRPAREALGLKAGDPVLVVVRRGVVILTAKPQSYSRALRGAAKGVYPTRYLPRERQAWQ